QIAGAGRMDEYRPAGADRLAGRWRKHPRQGHDEPAPHAGNLPQRHDPRRCAGAASETARRRHRTGRGLGSLDAPPPRPDRRDLAKIRTGTGEAEAQALRTGDRTTALHALSLRGCRRDDPRVERPALSILVRLSAYGGRAKPARPCRSLAGGCKRGNARPLLYPELRRYVPGGGVNGPQAVMPTGQEMPRPPRPQ